VGRDLDSRLSGHLGLHSLAVFALLAGMFIGLTEASELTFEATAALRKVRRLPSIIAACFTQAEFWP
jgi:hypothetical protein